VSSVEVVSSVELVSVEVVSSVELVSAVLVSSVEAVLSAATVSPIEEPKTRFRELVSSATPSRVNVELPPSASGAK
jgi:hypothetical protein